MNYSLESSIVNRIDLLKRKISDVECKFFQFKKYKYAIYKYILFFKLIINDLINNIFLNEIIKLKFLKNNFFDVYLMIIASLQN